MRTMQDMRTSMEEARAKEMEELKAKLEKPLREEIEDLRRKNEELQQQLEGLEMKADVDRAMFRESVGYLFDLAERPRCPTSDEFALAENIARHEAHGDPLDIEGLQDLYEARGVDMVKILIKGLEAS